MLPAAGPRSRARLSPLDSSRKGDLSPRHTATPAGCCRDHLPLVYLYLLGVSEESVSHGDSAIQELGAKTSHVIWVRKG